jgi:hypothetical protein
MKAIRLGLQLSGQLDEACPADPVYSENILGIACTQQRIF